METIGWGKPRAAPVTEEVTDKIVALHFEIGRDENTIANAERTIADTQFALDRNRELLTFYEGLGKHDVAEVNRRLGR